MDNRVATLALIKLDTLKLERIEDKSRNIRSHVINRTIVQFREQPLNCILLLHRQSIAEFREIRIVVSNFVLALEYRHRAIGHTGY